MKSLAFGATTLAIFVFTLSAADSVGFVPCSVDDTCTSVALSSLPELGDELETEATPTSLIGTSVVPERIRSTIVDIDLPVQDSDTRDIDELYEMLKDGPVRYVDSAKLGEEGNVLIFGHSSQLPVVTNQMYKAFNRVPDLKSGDTITLEGGGKEFVYRVLSVTSVDANEGVIDLSKTGYRLTLVTCDTLTGESARFVLEAELIGSYDVR